MKPDIHPVYRTVVFHDTSVNEYVKVGSTIKTEREIELDGVTYPYVTIDVSSKSHPFIPVDRKRLIAKVAPHASRNVLVILSALNGVNEMQVLNSLRNAKQRHPDCQIVKRKGRLYVICKTNPRFKAVQGRKKTLKPTVQESSAYQEGAHFLLPTGFCAGQRKNIVEGKFALTGNHFCSWTLCSLSTCGD